MAASYFPERLKSPVEATPLSSPRIGSVSTPGAQRLGALQSRIATVLSASYADLDIRDTLETLDSRQLRNTAATRRNLRLDVQQELIECNGEIVKDFGHVAEQLRRVGTAIEHLNKSCAAIRAHVAAAKRETAPVLDESSALTIQQRQTRTKRTLLEAFRNHFLLSDTELTALTSTAAPVDDAFFDALARAQRIHTDSQVLLESEDQHLGLEILEQSSKNVNAGFQKLFRWTQKELKTLDLENPNLSNIIRRALRALAERPQLFQGCLDFFAENRQHTLSDAFYAALTGNVATGSAAVSVPSSAIELNAHEPLRYISDMLAWVHAATVGEREALQVLFISDADQISKSLKAGHERQPWLQQAEDEPVEAFDGKKSLHDLVNRDMSGVMRQLRQRTEQTLHSHENATLAYQISNLVSFYSSIFATLLGSDSEIQQTLSPLTALAMEQFRNITRDHIVNLQNDISAAPVDLSAPDFLVDALESFRGLMKSYDTSFAGASTAEQRAEGFKPVLAEALEPYLNGCDGISKRMNSPESEVFAINCLTATRAVIKGPSYTYHQVEDIDATIEEQQRHLEEAVFAWFVSESGMRYLLEKLAPFMDVETPEELERLSRLKALDPETLADTAQRLDAFLPSAMEEARSLVGRLTDKMLMRRICEDAADRFTDEFEMVERLLFVVDEMRSHQQDQGSNGPLLLRDVFPRTSDEIKVLLS
ncbi:hypothetical protein MBLNU457_7521t1 [Dothideomycetes sp. NU457]